MIDNPGQVVVFLSSLRRPVGNECADRARSALLCCGSPTENDSEWKHLEVRESVVHSS